MPIPYHRYSINFIDRLTAILLGIGVDGLTVGTSVATVAVIAAHTQEGYTSGRCAAHRLHRRVCD